MKVYLLNTYQEDGPEDIRATLDRASVEKLLVTHPYYQLCTEEYKAKSLKKLREILDDGGDLGTGWGGFQLHIIDLE